MNARAVWGAAAVVWLLGCAVGFSQTATLLYSEGFESGWNGWTNDTQYTADPRYVWVIQSPTNGPPAAYGGAACAGATDPGTDCYLVSPPLYLPAVNQYTDHLWLYYWQWQKYTNTLQYFCLSDVKIRQLLEDPLTGGYFWGPWNIIDPGTSGIIASEQPFWRRRGIDLTLFGGWIVQIGFHHLGLGDPGWFVDDVEIWQVPIATNFPAMQGFEAGWAHWHNDRFCAWDIGPPAGGNAPSNTPEGVACAGTGLGGVAPTVFSGYLWTPAFIMPAIEPGEKVILIFKQWYDYPAPMGVAVRYSHWWSSIGWSFPQNIGTDPLFFTVSNQWTTLAIDLTALAGLPLPVRIGFDHTGFAGLGWFIDDARFEVHKLRMTGIERVGDDIRLSWLGLGGTTNVVQVCTGDATGNFAGSFTNLSAQMVIPGVGEFLTNYIHQGGATNAPARYYRLRQLP